jgi:putative hydrolase of the HAD superfamily
VAAPKEEEADVESIAVRPRAVLFDLWGTLIFSDEFEPRRGNQAVLARAETAGRAGLEELQELGARIVASTEPRELESRLEFTQASLLRMLIDSFGLRFRMSLDELEWIFWTAALRIQTAQGIRAALDGLAERGIQTCVVSNSSFAAATLERELENRGLRECFSFVISSADYGVRKPDPVIFEVALRRLGVAAEEAWFAGDNIEFDIEGASQAGLFPVAYRPNGPVPPHIPAFRLIKDWAELLPLIDQAGPSDP